MTILPVSMLFPEVDDLTITTADQLLRRSCTHEVIEAAEREGWAPLVWKELAELGLDRVGVPEHSGGVGGTLGDALAVVHVAGRVAAPVPIGDMSVLAGWLFDAAGWVLPPELVAVVPPSSSGDLRLVGGRLEGTARNVPWGAAASSVVALVPGGYGGEVIVEVPLSEATVEPDRNLAGEPRDVLHLHGATPSQIRPAPAGVSTAALLSRGALVRCVAMAGALAEVADLTIAYCNERTQFGKPIASFQAVQAHLVHASQQATLTCVAAATAAAAAASGPAALEIGAAKLLANRAAGLGAAAAHQAHGAMGMTREYSLHQLTRRLWAWRQEYGGEDAWARELGRRALSEGADGVYPAIAGGAAPV